MTDNKVEYNYQKGFNEGYLITKHLPDLSDSLAHVKNETPRLDGFREGRKEFILEQAKEHRPAWMKKTDKTKEAGEQKEKGQDKEPDR